MPPVIAIIPIIISVAVAVLKVSAIIKALILIAGFIAVTLLKKSSKPKGNRINQGAELSTKINPSLPRTVCAGFTAIGPSCHFAYTYTDNADKPNRYLLRVYQISDQPINSLVAVLDGKNTLTFAGDVTTGWFACNQHKNKDGVACMWMRVYKGVFSGAVADATLISVSGGQWTSAHKGTGLAYAIVKYDYDGDAFPNGEPELVFSVQGAKVYDDRLDSTVSGGSGSQRLTDPTTWAYSDNTAVVAAQYLRGFTINGKRIVGVGAESRDMLAAMLFSAYNTCDQSVAYSGGTEKRYVCSINFTSDETADDALSDLSLAMDGQIFDRGGSITIWPGAVRTPVLNLAPQDIDWTAEKSWQPKPGLDATVNAVAGNFVDKDNFFQERDLPIRTSAQWEADDGGQRFTSFLSLRAVNRWSQGQRVTHRVFQAGRYGGVVAFVGGIWLMEMEQGDWFTLTAPRWNMSSKYFVVKEITLTADMRVALIGVETATHLDDWAPASNEFDRTDTYWNAPAYTLPVPTFTLEDYWYYDDASGTQVFGITFTLLTPTGASGTYIDRIEIEWAPLTNLTDIHNAGFVTLEAPRKTITGLQPDVEYAFRARCTDGSRHGPWSAWPGVSGDPGTRFPPIRDTTFRQDVRNLKEWAGDGILSPKEKRGLYRLYGKLESQYVQVTTRALSLSITFAPLTAWRAAWQGLLNSYNPLWNDYSQDTDIYTGAFPDDNFPTGWILNSITNTGAGSAAGRGAYAILNDTSSASQGYISRSIVPVGATQYALGIVVKKDNVGQATRCPILQLVGTGGTAKTATVAFNTTFGTFAKSATADDAAVFDLGEAWFVYVVMTTGAGQTLLESRLYPAGSINLSTTLSNTPTGSVSVQDPVFALGNVNKLGPAALIGLETGYSALIQDLIRQTGNRDNAWNIPGSGFTLGDALNLLPLMAAGSRFSYSGDISYTAAAGTPASATISVTAGTASLGSVGVAYNAMSKNVTGTGGTTVAYYLYVDDLTYTGGTKTLQATTSFDVTAGFNGRVYIGYVNIVFPVSGSGSGGGGSGGGSYCVADDMMVHTKRGWIPAHEVQVGDKLRVLNSTRDGLMWVTCNANRPGIEGAYEIKGKETGVRVVASEATPITLQDDSCISIADADGMRLPFVEGTLDNDRLWWEEVTVRPLGLKPVRLISCGGHVYVAGATKFAGIATHNAVQSKL
jgi:hypothetical protein